MVITTIETVSNAGLQNTRGWQVILCGDRNNSQGECQFLIFQFPTFSLLIMLHLLNSFNIGKTVKPPNASLASSAASQYSRELLFLQTQREESWQKNSYQVS